MLAIPHVAAPIIATGMTEAIADNYAARLYTQWINLHEAAARSQLADTIAHKDINYYDAGWSEKGMRRWFERLKSGITLDMISSSFKPEKRGAFTATIDKFGSTANDATLYWLENGVERPVHFAQNSILLSRYEFARSRQRGSFKFRDVVAYVLSRHAAIRLIQRGGVHTVAELRQSIVNAWPRLSALYDFTRNNNYCAKEWHYPVRVSPDGPLLVAVISPLRGGFGGENAKDVSTGLGVRTFLHLEMAPASIRGGILELDHFLAGNADKLAEESATFGRLLSAVSYP
jgi:hypothetical protein